MDIRLLLKYRFQTLLIFLLTLVAVMPFFNRMLLVDLATTAVLITAASSAGTNRKLFITCLVLAILAIIAMWAAHLRAGRTLLLIAKCLEFTFFLLITIMILRNVFSATVITGETVAGAVCAYLMIGLMWANVYVILETVMPGSFAGPGEGNLLNKTLPLRMGLSHFNYFSFVTLSTLGYGDITPMSLPARNLSALEAIIGQLYLAVLIARLVGQQSRS